MWVLDPITMVQEAKVDLDFEEMAFGCPQTMALPGPLSRALLGTTRPTPLQQIRSTKAGCGMRRWMVTGASLMGCCKKFREVQAALAPPRML